MTITISTSPMATLTTCFLRYAVGSPSVRSSLCVVADQTSRLPNVTRPRTASISSQSRPGGLTAGRVVAATSVLPVLTGRRQDGAVLHEGRQRLRRGRSWDRRRARLDRHAVDAVQRLPDLAHRR